MSHAANAHNGMRLCKSVAKDNTLSKQGLHVSGNKLLDGNGEEFIFRGVNLPHAWFVDKTESSIKDIASLGANSARIVLACGHLYPKSSYDQVERIINWCENEGLICVLELHDFTGSDNPNDITYFFKILE